MAPPDFRDGEIGQAPTSSMASGGQSEVSGIALHRVLAVSLELFFSSVCKCPHFGPSSYPVKQRRLATVACIDTKTPCLSPTHLMGVWACSLLLLPYLVSSQSLSCLDAVPLAH